MFVAWADPAAKQRWTDCHADGGTTDSLDFRVGGHELQRALLSDRRSLFIDKVFLEIVPDARIGFAYTMTVRRSRQCDRSSPRHERACRLRNPKAEAKALLRAPMSTLDALTALCP